LFGRYEVVFWDGDVDPTEWRYRADCWRAPVAIAAIGLDGRLLWCNAAYANIVGVTPDELVGVDSASLVYPGEADQAVSDSVSRMATTDAPTEMARPIRLVRADGASVWVTFDSVVVGDAAGEQYVLTTMADVSKQVEAQNALARSDSWFRALLQHQSDIVTVIDLDGFVRYISPNCERLLG
jgi:PAS domain S-box-containing protein